MNSTIPQNQQNDLNLNSKNSSGKGDIPDGVRGLNFGAFFLNWIWGLGNGTMVALVSLIPCIGFVIPFILLFKGNEWAWRNKKWESVEHFKKVQRIWAFVGLGLLGAGIVMGIAIFFLIMGLMKNSEIYKQSYTRVVSDPAIIEMLGEPLEVGTFVTGNVSSNTDGGNADIQYTLTGPKGSANVHVKGVKTGGQWVFESFIVQSDDSSTLINMLNSTPTSPSSSSTNSNSSSAGWGTPSSNTTTTTSPVVTPITTPPATTPQAPSTTYTTEYDF